MILIFLSIITSKEAEKIDLNIALFFENIKGTVFEKCVWRYLYRNHNNRK